MTVRTPGGGGYGAGNDRFHDPHDSSELSRGAGRHPPKEPVPGALFPSGMHRPASTIQVR